MGKNLISNIKRAGYLGVVMALILSAMPVVPIGRVSAADCYGPTEADEIEMMANANVSIDQNINLCADINGSININPKNRNVTINFNGHVLTGDITIGGNSPILFTGNGRVNGAINADANQLTINSGTYSVDVNRYVRDPDLAAYQAGNEWRVETKLTNDNIKAPESITIYEGQVFDVASVVKLPEGSTSGLSYYSRDNNIASINFHGVNNEGSKGLLGAKVGSTSIAVRPLYDTTLVKNINVVVESGLKDIAIADIVMTQEDKKTVAIENVYHFDRASGVTYSIVSVSNDAIGAQISGDQLTVITGANGKKVEPGEYAVVVEALVNNKPTGIKKNVKVTVNKLFTDFSLEQADENDVIEIREDKWFALKISGAETVDALDKVRVAKIEVVDDGGVMHAKEDRIAGDKKGVGEAKINVTAEYKSGDNTYSLTKEFTVKVVSALEKIAVREASDTNNKGVKYGSDAGETDTVEIDKDQTKELKVSVHKAEAAVDVKVSSDDSEVAKIEQDGNNFVISSTKAGEATVTVIVTPKNAVDGAGTLTKTFKVKVNPILEDIAVTIESGDRTMTEDYEIDNGDSGKIIPKANDGLTEGITYTFEEIVQVKRLELDEDGSFKSGLNTKPETKVRITARDAKGREIVKDITIKINPVLNSLTLENDEITIYEEESAQIVIKKVVADSIKDKVVWSYNGYDKNIITVSDSGEVIGLKNGTTVVEVLGTFTSPLGKQYTARAEAKITVKPLLTGVRIYDTEGVSTKPSHIQTFYELDEVVYTVGHINKKAPVEYRAESANPDIVAVSMDGKKLIMKTFETTTEPGEEVVITVYAKDTESGKEVSRTIRVAVKPTLKSISAADVHMRLADEEGELSIEVSNPTVTPEFTYESSDESVATVVDGKIKALKAGKTTVTIKASYDGKNAETTADVYVYEELLDADKFPTHVVEYRDAVLSNTVIMPKAPKTGGNKEVNNGVAINSWMIPAGIVATMLFMVLMAGVVRNSTKK